MMLLRLQQYIAVKTELRIKLKRPTPTNLYLMNQFDLQGKLWYVPVPTNLLNLYQSSLNGAGDFHRKCSKNNSILSLIVFHRKQFLGEIKDSCRDFLYVLDRLESSKWPVKYKIYMHQQIFDVGQNFRISLIKLGRRLWTQKGSRQPMSRRSSRKTKNP